MVYLTADRGIAKVAKKLDIDYAEAIVHLNEMSADDRLGLNLKTRGRFRLLSGLL